MAPVGREFGSPDYERLADLDDLAVKATGSLLAARRWLDTPNPALEGQIPEEVARSPDGYAQVVQLLDSLMGLHESQSRNGLRSLGSGGQSLGDDVQRCSRTRH